MDSKNQTQKREIKFRAWNGNSILDWENLKSLRYAIDNENIDVMQYTGLKDVNGKDIYEGDILVRILPNGEHGRKIICEDIREVFMTNNIADDKHLIIGNIYENSLI